MTEPRSQEPPTEPPSPLPEIRGNPWERRAALGVVRGFLDALKIFVTSPTEAFSQTLKSGDYGSPLLFAIAVGWIGIFVGHLWDTMVGASLLSMLPTEFRSEVPLFLFGSGGLLMSLIFAPVMVIVGVFLWSAILHLCLVIVGGLDQTETGFEGSFRVVSYSTVAQLANLVPFVGDLLCGVWTLILAIIGAQQIHRTSQGKAIVAVLIPVAFCCVCVAMGLFMAGASLMAMFANQ